MLEENKTMEEWEEVKGESNFWIPSKEGDSAEGVIVVQVNDKFGVKTTIEQRDGKQLVLPSHKVLQSKLANCKVGDLVKVVYDHEELPKIRGQNPTKIYSVFTRRINTVQ